MSVVQYKGFQGSVCWEDGRLVIQVLHGDDFLTTECTDAARVQEAFRDLIDDYLETCAELGIEPSKSFKGSFNVRIESSVHRQAAMRAASAGQSLNAWVSDAIEEKLEKTDQEKVTPVLVAQFRRLMAVAEIGERAYRPRVAVDKSAARVVRQGAVITSVLSDDDLTPMWRGH